MPDHDFEHLDDKAFEQMSTALCAEHITRGLRIYGSGTDGGREATFEGKMNYSAGGPQWDGYLVVQCKQKQARGTPKEEAAWAIGQLNEEMDKYRTAKKKRRIPEYFLFITNAHLSAQLETGGKDKFIERLNYWKEQLSIKEVDVWDRDKLNNLVNITPKVAQRFGLMLHGDILSHVAQYVLAHSDNIETTLAVFLQEELRADQFVNLAQAGHASDERTPLARVFVDLRAADASSPKQSFHVVQSIQQASNRPIYPTLLKEEKINKALAIESERTHSVPTEEVEDVYAGDPGEDYALGDSEDEIILDSISSSLWPDPSRFVLIGGPGQGKSTVAQHLAQRHRAALLKANSTRALVAETERILQIVEEGAEVSGTGLPTYPRWPFRIVLEQFASALAKEEVKSVLEYIASLICKRTDREFTAQDVEMLLSNSASLVAFDGLDEVPAVSNRAQVLDAVRRFLLEVQEKDADLLIIATTRPQGYQADFSQHNFYHLQLQLFTTEEALFYAQKFVETKYATDPDRRERIMQRLRAAAKEEAIARLMQSPLQVTIMAALVDLVGNPPRERYQLFQRYYEIIYQREQERGLSLSDVLAHYRTGIEILHDRIGLLLQVEAEIKGKTESRISRERLEQLVRDYLVGEEHYGEDLARTTASFMDVALHRLVFIVPLEDERYGFEVRSLQEFSAARALMRDSYDAIKNRLLTIASIPYWRNTVLFAIGQAFATQNTPQCDMIMQLCRELNEHDAPLLKCTLAGSRLALDVLEDGIVEWRPGYRRLFIEAALLVLQLPHQETALRLVNLYSSRDEARYMKAVQAVTGGSEPEALVGLFTALIALRREYEVAWAESLLHKHWPTQLKIEQPLFKQLQRQFIRDEWFDKLSSRIAGASGLEWVQDHMQQGTATTVPWILNARKLRARQEKRVYLAAEKPTFQYHICMRRVPVEILDSLQNADLTHHEWLPFTLGREFMLDPTPENLATLLEKLVHTGGWQPEYEYEALPWQLGPLLMDAQSQEELLRHAQRARAGELGTAEDWKAAEQRWQTSNFTIADLTAISDEQWPYSSEIAERGIVPVGYFQIEHIQDGERIAALSLFQALSNAPSERYRATIAVIFWFVISHSFDTEQSIKLPIATIEQLAQASKWQVSAVATLVLLERNLDWIGEVKALDAIGHRISVLGNQEPQPFIIDQNPQHVVKQLVPLVGTQHIREGILRFIAALAISEEAVPPPSINPALLSAEGQVALAALQLLSETPTMGGTDLAQLVISLWRHLHPRTGAREMPRVLNRLLERSGRPFTPVVVEALGKLYADSRVELDVKVRIIKQFIVQAQYRTSGLADPVRKTELGTDWLFDKIN
jgi:hypothetical protein